MQGKLRIRFEMKGPGEVCLDGVQLYDLLFPLKFYKNDEAEILQFVQLSHAAKNAFEEGRIVDCTRHLERYWPRFLAEYTPHVKPVVPAAIANQPNNQQPPETAKEPPAPGFSERIRSAIPFLR